MLSVTSNSCPLLVASNFDSLTTKLEVEREEALAPGTGVNTQF